MVFNYILFREIILLNMQKPSYQASRQLMRCPSIPSYQANIKNGTNTTIHTSSSSIESVEDEYRKQSIRWLMQFDRKITKDTNYLSVFYLEAVIKNGLMIRQSNWQLIAASIMLFSSKMNQIYPPSIESILKRCKTSTPVITKSSLIDMQAKILNLLNFDVAIQSPFNIVSQVLTDSKKDIEECQKLLKIIMYNKQISQQQSQISAYAIIYLIARKKIDSLIQGETRMKVKIAAQKIYNYYKEVRKNYESRKAKQKLQVLGDEKDYSTKTAECSSTKQNMVGTQIFYSLSSYKKNDQNNRAKDQQNITHQLTRINSSKFISKQRPFSEATNIGVRQKQLYHCDSRDDLQARYKSPYLHS